MAKRDFTINDIIWGMRIAVCIKQVPDTTSVRIDPVTNTLMREGVVSVTNPFDLQALEQALVLKDVLAAEVTVISMGPPQAEEVLRDALARGADRAFLVSSRVFGGADTLATAYTLAQALRMVYGKDALPELMLFGQQAVDGDTAQVGPGVSACLDVPLVTYVRYLEILSGGSGFRARTSFDDCDRIVEGRFPVVMTVGKDAAQARFASLSGTMSARAVEIPVLDETVIHAEAARLGLNGSPTKVMAIASPPVKTRGKVLPWDGDARELVCSIRAAVARKEQS